MVTSYIFKPPKITRYLAYKFKPRKNFPATIYRLIDTQNGKIAGFMSAYPETIEDNYRQFSPNANRYVSFFIQRLKILPEYRRQGAGTALINIAKRESIRNLCCGNVHLISHNVENPGEIPHLFYRKQGFKCNKYNKKTEEQLDKWIKEGKRPEDFKCSYSMPMYIEKCVQNQDEMINFFYKLKVRFPNIFNLL